MSKRTFTMAELDSLIDEVKHKTKPPFYNVDRLLEMAGYDGPTLEGSAMWQELSRRYGGIQYADIRTLCTEFGFDIPTLVKHKFTKQQGINLVNKLREKSIAETATDDNDKKNTGNENSASIATPPKKTPRKA